ncbi:MAG: hypothetical protein N2423_01955 [Novosphingobium sp.]|nr:hypothetical protein [Novosphingobium sp.]
MAAFALRHEERIGLVAAIVAHGALLALLVLRPHGGDVVMPPERIAVTLSEEVGLVSTSPDPSSTAAPDVAPMIGDGPAPEAQAVEPVRPPEPARPKTEPPRAAPEPARPRIEAPRPAPVEMRPAPVARQERPRPPAVAPQPQPQARAERNAPAPAARTAATPAPRPATEAPPQRRAGGSRLGNDFLEGVQSGPGSSRSSAPPAEAIGPSVRAALSGAITRQLKPHWVAPQGVEAEQLITVLAWELNRDGSLAGTPRVVRQLGITDANRAQAGRHAEQAIRAVQLAAPFQLPAEYYDAWKRVSAFQFDKRLSQ